MGIRSTVLIAICCIAAGMPRAADSAPKIFPATVVAVNIPAEDLVLKGTLYLPERQYPVPGLVLVHGSGPQQRNVLLPGQLNMPFGFTIAVFESIALALQQAGVAVVVYDKRTCYPGNGCAENGYPAPAVGTITLFDFASDAVSALRFIGSHDAVDQSRLYVAGHSQGGQLIPEIMTRLPELAGALVVAGNYRSVDVLLDYQATFSRELLESVGMVPEQIDATVAPLEEMSAQVARLKAGSHDGSAIGGSSAIFWKSWIDVSSAIPAQVKSSAVPLHVIGGAYDWTVPPAEIAQWQGLFDSLPDRRAPATAKLLPCITHALNCIDQPDWQRIKPGNIGKTVDSRVIDEIIEFIETSAPVEGLIEPIQPVPS